MTIATPKMTKTQERVVKMVTEAFGGDIKVEFIGRKVWITGTNYTRKWYNGDSFFGTIGVRGSFELILQRIGGNKVIVDDLDVKIWMKDAN